MDNKVCFNIDNLLGKSKNRIYRVGVELEGGWDTAPKFEHGEKIDHDGSVKIDPIPLPPPEPITPAAVQAAPVRPTREERTEAINRVIGDYNRASRLENRVTLSNIDPYNDFVRFFDYRGRLFGDRTSRDILTRLEAYSGIGLGPDGARSAIGAYSTPAPRFKNVLVGEVASPVLEVAKVEEWMRNCYPQHVNKTCGLHVHMSFRKSLHYERLMVPEYQGTIINYLSKWGIERKIESTHALWPRLSGQNEYCKHEFFPDQQARKGSKVYEHHGGGNRYTAINYCHGQHGTIECRVLPMFQDVDMAIEAVKKVISITNACLRVEVKRGETFDAKLIEDSVNGHVETRREII